MLLTGRGTWRTMRWPGTGRVFVNVYGAPINPEQANAELGWGSMIAVMVAAIALETLAAG